jgi:hypothetical protein
VLAHGRKVTAEDATTARAFAIFATHARWSAFLFVIGSAVVFAWYVSVIRSMPVHASAALLLWQSFAAVLAIADLGAAVHVVRAIAAAVSASDAARASAIARLAMTWSITGTVALGSLACVVAWMGGWLRDADGVVLVAIVALAVANQVSATGVAVLKGSQDIRRAATLQAAVVILGYGPSAALAWITRDPRVCFAALVGGTLVASALVARRARLPAPNATPSDAGYRLRHHLAGGVLFFPQSLAGIFFNGILRFIVDQSLGPVAVARIAVSYAMSARLHAVLNAYLEPIFPMGLRLAAEGVGPGAFTRALWQKGFPLFALGAAVLVAASVVAGRGVPALVALFCLGTWIAVCCAPRFHLGNALQRGAAVSALSLGSLAIFAGAFLSLVAIPGQPLGLLACPIAYVASQLFVLAGLNWLAVGERP